MKKSIIKFAITAIFIGCVAIFVYYLTIPGWRTVNKPSEYIWKLYNIGMPDTIDKKGSVTLLNEHTVISILPQQAIDNLLSNRLSGYSNWRKVSPDESYGNIDVVVYGSIKKSLFEAHRHINGLDQQIIVDTSRRKIILFNT